MHELQQLIQEHYDWVNTLWTPTKETYLGLGKVYLDHPDLIEYLVCAMTVFAEHKLT